MFVSSIIRKVVLIVKNLLLTLKMPCLVSVGLLLLMMMLCVKCVASDTIIDLTHPLTPSTLYWPGVPEFKRRVVQNSTNENNIWIEVGAFSSGEHGGTHIDAPRHFYKDGPDLKDLPLENTIGEGVTIDVRDEALANHDYALTVEKIEEWERQHGRIPQQAAVLINSGWSQRWSDPKSFLNTNSTNDSNTFHFPIVSSAAAQWLVSNRKIKMLGMDVPSPDGPRDRVYPVHTMLLSKNIIILENMLIPNTIPARGFRVHASPIRIEGGTGVQTRIYAMMLNNASNVFSAAQYCRIVQSLLAGSVVWLMSQRC